MLDIKSVHRKTSEEIQTAGHDEKELLYNYLEELLLLFEVKQLALGNFTVTSITPTRGEFKLKGRASGEPNNPKRQTGKVGVKGLTNNRWELEKGPEKRPEGFFLD